MKTKEGSTSSFFINDKIEEKLEIMDDINPNDTEEYAFFDSSRTNSNWKHFIFFPFELQCLLILPSGDNSVAIPKLNVDVEPLPQGITHM